jgi:type I restriction enzyme M protein
MLTGEIRSKVDQVWNAFWAGGIANPLEVIEQITYLLFMRGLDEIQTREESRANMLGRPIERVIFPAGTYRQDRDGNDVTYQELRWSRLKNEDPARMFLLVSEFVFPFLREMGEAGTAHAEHMKGARFTIPTPGLLAKVVDMLAEIPLEDRDTKGDLYEYMLAKIATAGQNGQFRTPRHIIKLMVELMAPTPNDVICDPASGTCGFLVAAGEYLRARHSKLFMDSSLNRHFHESMFHGYDFDQTMLRIGSMNMQLHGVEGADIRYRDSLASAHSDDADKYSLVLANPPFAGSLDYETTAADLLSIVKTKKTELLFMALFLKLLKPGGRAAVIVPDGVLFGSSTAHKAIRKMLVEDHRLDAIVKLPSGVFKPYAGVSTAIVFFTKTNSGGTDHVWFYDVQADGMSLDDKRQMLVAEEKFGPVPKAALSAEEHARNNLPDVLARWKERAGGERENPRTSQSFTVAREEIAAADYDLSLNRYREVVHEAADHRPPREIIAELLVLEDEIAKGLKELEAML